MVKLLFTLCVSFFISNIVRSQGLVYEWAKSYGNGLQDNVSQIIKDKSGNVYTVGKFKSNVDFDPGPSNFNMSLGGSADDGYILKLDSLGDFLWAKGIGAPSGTGSSQNVWCKSITVDDSNSVYITGGFTSTIDFDPGPGVFNMTSSGGTDVFMLKLDSLGDFLWAKSINASYSSDILYDHAGHIYVAGAFSGTTDFDPGPGVFNLNGSGMFVQKLNLDGDFIWAQNNVGGSVFLNGTNLVIDEAQIYCTGYFLGTADFNLGPNSTSLVSNGVRDCYVTKMDTSGQFIWAKSFGGPQIDESAGIAIDSSGSVYVTGSYNGTVDFDPGTSTFGMTSNGDFDMFILKLDTSGNFVWAKSIGDTLRDQTFSIVCDGSNLYLTGYYWGTVDFDPNANVFNLVADNPEPFLLKLDTTGKMIWAKAFESTFTGLSLEFGSSIYVDSLSNDILLAGEFRDSTDFDFTSGTAWLVSEGERDNFILKLSQCESSTGIDIQMVCDSLTWIDGVTYTSNNNSVTHILYGAATDGCDSIVTLDLTILQSSAATDAIQACDSLVWLDGTTYFSDNTTATFTIPNSAGCDSIITLNLTIVTNNLTLSVSNTTISAVLQAGINYQWLDCDNNYALLNGETSNEYIAISNGNYAIEITNGSCIDTSECITISGIGLSETDPLAQLVVFPNPTNGQVTISSEGSVEVSLKLYNALGQLVLTQKNITLTNYQFNIAGEAGIYNLEMDADGMLKQFKIVKK